MARPSSKKLDKLADKILTRKNDEKAAQVAADVTKEKTSKAGELTETVFDVCMNPEGRKYQIVKIKYSLETGEAMIEGHYDFENSIVHKSHDQGKKGLQMMYERMSRNNK